MYRELGSRLGIAGQDARAMQHYAALLTIDPADADARKQLRQLADRSGQHDLHAASLVAAAEASEGSHRTTLLIEAAHAYRDLLNDKDTAAELYSRVLESEEPEQSAALAAAHSLAECSRMAAKIRVGSMCSRRSLGSSACLRCARRSSARPRG